MKEGWQTATLGTAFTTVTGNTPPKKNEAFYGRFMPFIKPPELCNAELDSANDGLSEAGVAIARTAPQNSILVSCIGNLGKIGLNTIPVAFNQQINAIFPDIDKSIPRFMFYQVLSSSFKDQLEELASGTTIPIVNKSKFNSIKIVFPPIPEQKRIVSILDESFEAIDIAKANTEKNLQNTRALFDSILFNSIGTVKKGWHSKKLGDVCDVLKRGIFPKYLEDGGICVLNQKCIRNHAVSFDPSRRHDISLKKVPDERFVQLGDVLVNSTGTGTLGRVAQIRNLTPEQTTVDSHVTIVRPNKGLFHIDFFGYAMILIEEEIKSAGEGCGGQTELARSTLAEKFFVSFPEDTIEQKRIVSILDSLSLEIQNLESICQQKLAALEELKKSLLHQAFSGGL